MSYTVKSGDLWECALYLTLGCKLAGIEPVLVNGRVSCQLIIEGENLAELQKQYFAGTMEARIFEFRRVFGYLHSTVNKSKKKFQNMLKNTSTKLSTGGSTELTNRGATSLTNNGGVL
jgi:hypothetical protein